MEFQYIRTSLNNYNTCQPDEMTVYEVLLLLEQIIKDVSRETKLDIKQLALGDIQAPTVMYRLLNVIMAIYDSKREELEQNRDSLDGLIRQYQSSEQALSELSDMGNCLCQDNMVQQVGQLKDIMIGISERSRELMYQTPVELEQLEQELLEQERCWSDLAKQQELVCRLQQQLSLLTSAQEQLCASIKSINEYLNRGSDANEQKTDKSLQETLAYLSEKIAEISKQLIERADSLKLEQS